MTAEKQVSFADSTFQSQNDSKDEAEGQKENGETAEDQAEEGTWAPFWSTCTPMV